MEIRTAANLYIQNCISETQLVNPITNIAYPTYTLLQPYLLDILYKANDWINPDELAQYISSLDDGKIPKEQAEATVQEMINNGLLEEKKSSPISKYENALSNWQVNGWQEAQSYHLHTNFIQKMDYSLDPHGYIDKGMMVGYVSEEKIPCAYKDYQDVPIIKLVPYDEITQQQKNITQIFEDHVTCNPVQGPIGFDELSWYLNLAFGQTRTRKLPITGEHIAKTVPSGGSRHPIEVYPIIFSVDGIEPGVYHYNVRNHALEQLKAGNFSEALERHIITLSKRVKFLPKIAFIFTCIFERSMFRYREARSYRVMHYDLGHLMQNAAYLASSIQYSTYRGYSLHENEIENLIEIDGLNESAMSYMLLG
ncbi:MAG: oxidase [Gammaproteobacteria bacterium]|jgi:SagB-type dehydrogenase family enzyme|nr:oxidase [Gammaproteobacteria bacterium]